MNTHTTIASDVSAKRHGSLTGLIEAKREPLAEAFKNWKAAEADLNGLTARAAAGIIIDRKTIREVCHRRDAALHAMDEVRYAILGVEAINGRRLCPADSDDMLDAVITRVEHSEFGPGIDDRFNALGAADYGIQARA